jgi:tRNA 2-selenouridine synthase
VEQSTDVTVAQLDDFDEVIDVRSPAEFALDHVPGAINLPVLDDDERARIGTLHKQVSAFEARRAGAALVARNIARILEAELAGRPARWRPLVYCWRGGGRSDALCEILRRVGWRPGRLRGGYRAYRRRVLQDLARTPADFRFRVLCGRTGAGKSRVLESLAELGAQALDLEQLAQHRGSVLGELPDAAQPTQKMFESRVWQRLRTLDPSRPVFVEAESRKIGNIQVPAALIEAMRSSPCVRIEAAIDVRVPLLLEQYRHFTLEPQWLHERLRTLTAHYGRQTVALWCDLAAAGRHAELVESLLATHYDPAYDHSLGRNFVHAPGAPAFRLDAPTPLAIRATAASIFEHCTALQPA